MVKDGDFSKEKDYVTVFRRFSISKDIQIALLVKSYGHFAEWVDFAYWLSFITGEYADNRATPSSFYIFICFIPFTLF